MLRALAYHLPVRQYQGLAERASAELLGFFELNLDCKVPNSKSSSIVIRGIGLAVNLPIRRREGCSQGQFDGQLRLPVKVFST